MGKRGPKPGSGNGTVVQLGDGRYLGEYRDAYGETHYVFGKNKRQVRADLNDLVARHKQGVGSNADQTLGEWLATWLASSTVQNLERTTIADYTYKVRLIPEWVKRKPLDQVRPADVEKMMGDLSADYAPSTIAQVRSVLRRSLNKAVTWRTIPVNPAALVDPPKQDPPKVEPLTEAEARALLDAVAGHRLASLYAVALAVGLRESEAIGLRWSDVDLDAGTLAVTRQRKRTPSGEVYEGKPKTRASARQMRLPDFAVQALRRHRREQAEERLQLGADWEDNDYVWPSKVGTALGHRNLLRHLYRLCEEAGIRRVSFHTLRHSAATLMLAQGVPERVIMDVLGHSTLAMIVRYQHVNDALRDQAADAMDRALGAAPG